MRGLLVGVVALTCLAVPAAKAQSTPASVYCVNNRIMVERAMLSQMQSGRGSSEICLVSPSFDF